MLNELHVLLPGLSAAGIEVSPRHADVSSPGRADALKICLNSAGAPADVGTLDRDRVVSLWTLRNGKHNSFPYLQLKKPLLAIPTSDDWREAHEGEWESRTPADRRQYLRDLSRDHGLAPGACGALIAKGLQDSLRERLPALSALQEPHAAVPAVVTRMLSIRDEPAFAGLLLRLLLSRLGEADDALLGAAKALLTGRFVQSKLTGYPVWFDILPGEFERNVADKRHAAAISRALSGSTDGPRGVCLMSGIEAPLHEGPFPQPSVPVLGQPYLFSKNSDIPAAYRYGRADTAGLPLDAELAQKLAGALSAITQTDYKNITWRSVPGEKPKTLDLLVAFVDGVPEAPVAGLIAADEPDQAAFDPSQEETGHLDEGDRAEAAAGIARGEFRARAECVVEAVRGKVGADFRKVPVSIFMLRKVDTGNSKAILHRSMTVGNLYDSAIKWTAAIDNLPPWLRMPVPRERRVERRAPPAIAPLQLPRATRAMFLRGGAERAPREPVGVAAADALSMFLGETGAEQIAKAALRTVLDRQDVLLSGVAQALRRDQAKDGLKTAQRFDRSAALQAATLLGLLLAKNRRWKEDYMGSAAFRLGQVLAAADVIHAGYCADIRKGQTPPTLLGNSMLSVARGNPVRALAMLGQRLAPYLAWVQTRADWDKAHRLTGDGKEPGDKAKGWAIKSAISHAARVRGVAEALGDSMPNAAETDDTFRAELLLGYVAGLPKVDRRPEPEGAKE